MRLFLTLAVAVLALSAAADELWTSDYGPILWEADIGETAVLRLDETNTGGVVRLLVPGLARDVAGGRGAYQGIWVADNGETPCLTEMIDPISGAKTPHWGTFSITFLGNEFPSNWAGAWGACLNPALDPITGLAVVSR